jgi:hypothetical protein
MERVPARLDGIDLVVARTGVVAGTTTGVVAGTPGMDAHPVKRYRVEDARPTDLEGEAGGERTYLLKDKPRRIAVNIARPPELCRKQ